MEPPQNLINELTDRVGQLEAHAAATEAATQELLAERDALRAKLADANFALRAIAYKAHAIVRVLAEHDDVVS